MTDTLDRDWAGLGYSGAPPVRPVIVCHDADARREAGLRLPRKGNPAPTADDQGDLDTWWAWVSGSGSM